MQSTVYLQQSEQICCCVFFLSVSGVIKMLKINNNALISDIGIFPDKKVNLVGTFERKKLKIPSSFWKGIERNDNFGAKPIFKKIAFIFLV